MLYPVGGPLIALAVGGAALGTMLGAATSNGKWQNMLLGGMLGGAGAGLGGASAGLSALPTSAATSAGTSAMAPSALSTALSPGAFNVSSALAPEIALGATSSAALPGASLGLAAPALGTSAGLTGASSPFSLSSALGAGGSTAAGVGATTAGGGLLDILKRGQDMQHKMQKWQLGLGLASQLPGAMLAFRDQPEYQEVPLFTMRGGYRRKV